VKLSASVITGGRYYRAGEEVPDRVISDAMRRYAVADIEEKHEPAPSAPKPQPKRTRWGGKPAKG
jgi:hypothetical protein